MKTEIQSQSPRNQAFLRAYVTGNMDEYFAQYPVDLSIDNSPVADRK